MTYVVFDNKIERPLRFDSFVRDLDIITTAEPVHSCLSATQFDKKEDGEAFIQRLQDSHTYDTLECEVREYDELFKAEAEKEIQEHLEKKARSWAVTDTDTKRSILRKMLKKDGQEAVDEWLKIVHETSGITPMTDDEFIDRKVNEIESKYGIRVTDKQREQLFKRFVEGEQSNGQQ